MSGPNPQDPTSPLYDFIDTQPTDTPSCSPTSTLSHFTVRQFIPTAITAAFPVVVTIAGHGFLAGQSVRATKFIRMPFASATGMEQLNGRLFYVQQPTVNTFELYDQDMLQLDGRGYTPFIAGGEFTLVGPVLCVNPSVFP